MYRPVPFDVGANAYRASVYIPWDTTSDLVPMPVAEDTPKQEAAVMVRSPLDAMQMAEASGASEALPITVTITLTTVLWPGTAH